MKTFVVTFKFSTPAGKRVKWSGRVDAVPGVNIFDTARDRLARAKKGTVAHMFRAEMVPV